MVFQVRHTQKKIWLLTYGASSPSITHDILRVNTGMVTDECYTMCDGVHKYTLIHLVKKERKYRMQMAMAALLVKQKVIQASLFDEESIIGHVKWDESTENLPNSTSFKWFVQCMNEKGLHVDEWVKPGKPRSLLQLLKTNKRATVPNLESLSKEEIITKFKALSAESKSFEHKLASSTKKINSLMQELQVRKSISDTYAQEINSLETQLVDAQKQIAELQAKKNE